MNTLFRNSFVRDLKKVHDRDALAAIRAGIVHIERAESINALTNLRKLTGSGSYFRLRVGDYRLGLKIDGNQVEFVRCLHRRDIYRYFP